MQKLNRPYILTLYAIFGLVILYPIASVTIPSVGDYLNHLARAYIISTIDSSPDLRRYYEVHWLPVPYLTGDLIVILFSKFFSIYDAGRIFVGLCLLMPVAGTAALHYAVYRQISVVPLAAYLFSYNTSFANGHLSYVFSIGLCLLIFAAWVATEKWSRWWRSLIFALPVLVLYFTHLFGIASYCLAVAGFEVARSWRAGFRPLRDVLANWLAAAAQTIPAIIAFSITILGTHGGRLAYGPPVTTYGDIDARLLTLESPFIFLGGRAELGMAILIVIVAVAGILSGRIRLAPKVWPAAAALALGAVLMPEELWSVWGTHIRFPLPAVLILVGAMSLRLTRSYTALFVAAVALLAFGKVWFAASALQIVDRQVAEYRKAVAQLPTGARVLAVFDTAPTPRKSGIPQQMTLNFSMTAIIDRHDFVPSLFTSTVIVKTKPELESSSTPDGAPISVNELMAGMEKRDYLPLFFRAGRHRIYWYDWQHKYDFLLYLDYGGKADLLPKLLSPVGTSSLATLYRIRTEPPA